MSEILFEELDISKELKHALIDMEFAEATPVQSQSIPAMMEGHDIVAQAPTGTGKTCAFGIPLVETISTTERNVAALVLCPTRELVVQTTNELLRLTKYKKSIRIVAVYGGQNIERQILALKRKPQIIVATPGRLMDHMRRKTIRLEHLQHLVMDEADEMLDMGFRDDIDTILQAITEEHQTVLFSATMSKEILNITKKYLHDPVKVQITKTEITVPSVKQLYLEVNQTNKMDVLARLIDVNDFKLSMVFCNTKREVDELAHEMTARGYNAEGLHGDMKQSQRDRVMHAFKNGKVEILIATDVAARGIDIKDVDAVFNYDLPEDLEYYVHRIGRTGRANREGVAYSLVSRREMYRLQEIMHYTKAKIKFMTVPKVSEITDVRTKQTLNDVLDVISHSRLDSYAEAIEKFLEDSDDDITILDIAAAFLSREVGTSDLEEIEDQPRFHDQASSGRGGRRNSSNANSVRMFVNLGKMDKLKRPQISKLLTGKCGVSEEQIYDIDIMEKFSFLEVDSAVADSVLSALNDSQINGRKVVAEISVRKRSGGGKKSYGGHRGSNGHSGNGHAGSRQSGSRRSGNGKRSHSDAE